MPYSKIIAAPCGCGKTYFANEHSNLAIDVETIFFSKERLRISTTHIINGIEYSIPITLFDVVKDSIGVYEYILIPISESLFYQLMANRIDFTVIVPKIESLYVFIDRFKQRGDCQSFIDYQKSLWFDNLIRLYENKNLFYNFLIMDDDKCLSDMIIL